MLIHYMHSYCGGRLITGLFNPIKDLDKKTSIRDKTAKVFELCAEKWSAPANGSNEVIDPWPYLPETVEEFLQILKKFLYTEHGSEGFQGVVFAVTNYQQTHAHKYLQAAGFKKGGEFRKHHVSHDCITWIGDYRKDMYPILAKVPNYKPVIEVKHEPKFAAPPANTRPQAQTGYQPQVSQPVPNTIRDRAEQTLSSSGRIQSTPWSRSR